MDWVVYDPLQPKTIVVIIMVEKVPQQTYNQGCFDYIASLTKLLPVIEVRRKEKAVSILRIFAKLLCEQ